jgi:hypothetical protein
LKKISSKRNIHNQIMSVLNMQKDCWNIFNFDQTFDHGNFLINETLSCMWLMEIKWTLSPGLALDSLHSHGWDLGRGQHFPPYNILWTLPWGLHGNDFLSWDSKVGVLKFINYKSYNFANF